MSREINVIKRQLLSRVSTSDTPQDVLKDAKLKTLLTSIATQPAKKRATFGKAVNLLKRELEVAIEARQEVLEAAVEQLPIDVTAPWDVNAKLLELLPAEHGSIHPLMADQQELLDIFARMGFSAVESRQLDDDFHMFASLNFPKNHPARGEMDTFVTEQTDADDQPFIAPAHTSTMQNRVLVGGKKLLENDQPIACVIPGRVFRNEDVDASHEHTFTQLEGVYVDKTQRVHTGMLIATLRTFLQEYYGKELEVKTQPFYFPFTEPSFELIMSCPFCDKAGCSVCKHSGWVEILGCGMIHPKVLELAHIDPKKYAGFAWGVGTMRLTMMKHGIEDIRLFNSGKLDFLRQF